MKRDHGEQKYECDKCKATFTCHYAWKNHLKAHVQKFPCPVCKAEFNRKDNLKTHMRRHTGEKPYACSVCHERFTYYQTAKNCEAAHQAGSGL